ncbi:extradiol ring-cleavage dioxygenase-like, partial [Silene latifolia]|uniref:extradiol ring-cleavage dioxygenase-like n=1 Tax=Silene latifolia TaxID=37657 RepID=UPI003D780E9F
NIPICILSIQMHMDGTHHFNVGRALSPLMEDNVLIVGTRNATNNLLELRLGTHDGVVPSWALEFDGWLEDRLTTGRFQDVNEFQKKAPHAERAHPFSDHLYPLHVALGAAGENARAELIYRSWDLSTLSYAFYEFTSNTLI